MNEDAMSTEERMAYRYGDCEPKHQLRNLIRTALATEWDGVHTEDYLDDVIAIIRTALLSEPAVDAAMAVVEYRSQEATAAQDWKEERDDWKEAVTAAWDSVMGEEVTGDDFATAVDALADDAVEQHRNGQTIPLRDVMKDLAQQP